MVHPDLTIEPLRHPLTEFSLADRQVHEALLFPPDPNAPEEEDEAATQSEPPVRRAVRAEVPTPADSPIIDIEPESVN